MREEIIKTILEEANASEETCEKIPFLIFEIDKLFAICSHRAEDYSIMFILLSSLFEVLHVAEKRPKQKKPTKKDINKAVNKSIFMRKQ